VPASRLQPGVPKIVQSAVRSVILPVSQLLWVCQLLGMVDVHADAAHLRKLAAKCRRVAAHLTDEKDCAALRQMAAEYEALANRIEHPTMPNPQPRSSR